MDKPSLKKNDLLNTKSIGFYTISVNYAARLFSS